MSRRRYCRPRDRRDPRDIRLQHLLEQADAAQRDAWAAMQAHADQLGGDLFAGATPGPILTDLLGRMREALRAQLEAGLPITCEHGGILPRMWIPWAPARLLCPRCAIAEFGRIQGTAENNRCDHCRQVHERLWGMHLLVPATIVECPEHGWEASPPITVSAHLCRGCRTADRPDLPLSERPP